jgi:hypothetical protein
MNLAEASSGGNANVPGHEGVKFGLNVYWAQQMNGDWVDRTIQRLPRWMHAPAYIISILIWWVGALAALAIMPVAAYLIGSLLQFRG